MRQVAQNYRSGELRVLDVPPPACAPGGVLVRSLYSLVSAGTELMKVEESKMSLVAKARARPDQVRKVLDAAYQQGPVSAYKKAIGRLDSYTPLGYSLSGVVIALGDGVNEFTVGQMVACAGNEFALHAELNWVPSNLCVPVPDGVAPRDAAFATVGAIALQGVRQAQAQIGDVACVVGLGLVGQLLVRLLVASGIKVVGLDVVADRCAVAEKAGAMLCATPDEEGITAVEGALAKASGGLGADRVFLVTSGTSNEPARMAARLCRDRATVVDIGKCKLDLPWNEYYEKELKVRFSRSYGPGRYDPVYEIEGVDYPPGYVRWTERRNLACFLDLLARGDVDLDSLVDGVFALEEAPRVYEQMSEGSLRGIGLLFEYPQVEDAPVGAPKPEDVVIERNSAQLDATEPVAARRPGLGPRGRKVSEPQRSRPLRVGFIGAGNYASSMLLPHLAVMPGIELARVATRRPLSAANAKRKFGFTDAGTDVDAVLGDDSLEAVFIVTRHSSHADLTCRALEAGKAVFVEKPLAIRSLDLRRILDTADTTGNDRVMVGFNRRFAPMLVQMRSQFGKSVEPMVVRYLVNGARLQTGSWYADDAREGSRFAGEGGHFVDTVSWWIGHDPVETKARLLGGRDDLEVSLRYPEGSAATVAYLTNGHPRFPKETFEAFGGGRAARMENFRRGCVWTGRRCRRRWSLRADKGQRTEIEAFLDAIRSGGPMPISLTSIAATTAATLVVAGQAVLAPVDE